MMVVLRALYLLLNLPLLEYGVFAQVSSPETCPTLGSNAQTPYSQSNRERLFMNFGAPAQCNGTVTSWRYCSYNRYLEEEDECDDSERYTSVFLVYRQTGPSTYEPVPGSRQSVTLTLRCPSDGGFRCDRVETLSQEEQFTIQENDIVAACLMDTGSTNPLRIAGEQSSSPSNQVYQYDANNYEDCTTAQLQSIDAQNSAFTSNGGRYRLHLYAETDSSVAQCSGGSNPPPFTASTSSGTFLNTLSPITCTDTITSWHYCYYPSETADSQATYTAAVGVWRVNANLNQYELLPGSNYTLSLVQPASTPARIFCKTEILQPQDYVSAQMGDVVGVTLPSQNPLALLASSATGYSLLKHSGLVGRPLQMSELSEESNMALHLFPTIEFVPTQTSTTRITTTIESNTTRTSVSPTSTMQNLHHSTSLPENESSTSESDSSTMNVSHASGGESVIEDFIAIAVGILILLIAIFAVAGIIVYKMCVFRRKQIKVAGGRIRHNVACDHEGIEMSLCQQLEPSSEYMYAEPADNEYAMIPHYEPHTLNTVNEYSEIRFHSQVEACAAVYSEVLEQVKRGKKFEDEEDPYYSPANKESELYAQLRQQGINPIRQKDIELTAKVLGEGQFSVVCKGIWTRNWSNGIGLDVAVKTLKEGNEERDKVKFLQEAAIMAQFRHPNVVTLYGVVSTGSATMLIVELLPKGDLRQHLIALKPDPGMMLPSHTPRMLLVFSQQIALGMLYLSSKGFVHRDLAARNILLSDGGICKIADFGMSRDLAEADYYVSQGGKVPIKWTAPEALHFHKYSTASDVWSYGCVLYEIWSLGHKPFGAMKNPEVIAKVDSGYRLPPPPGCPRAIYKIMVNCWHPDKANRSGFRGILLGLLESEEVVLEIPSDMVNSSQAAVLSAPLEAGFKLYPRLQTMYCT